MSEPQAIPVAKPINMSASDQTVLRVFRLLFLLSSIAIFLASLPCVGYYTDQMEPPHPYGPALWLLAFGWLAVLDGSISWLANPFLLMAWLTMPFRRFRYVSLVCAVLALLLAASFQFQKDILINEAGTRSNIVQYGTAYWLWLASTATAIPGSLLAMVIRKKGNRTMSKAA